MKKLFLLLLLVTGVIGSLFAQDTTMVDYNNETLLYGKKISKPIRFINKDAKDVELTGLIALGKFNFDGHFAKPVGPKELTVRKCDFYTSHFNGPYFQTLTFDNCHFQTAPTFLSQSDSVDTYIFDADFNDCTFTDGLNLSNVIVGNGVSIAGTMNGVLDLSNITVKNPLVKIDLRHLYPNNAPGAKIDSAQKIIIDLTGAPIANIIMDYNRFTLEPASLQDKQNATSIYTALLANFKTRGFDDSYELANIDFQKFKSHHGETWLARLFLPFIDRLQDLWWKYGYEKFRILIITPSFLVLFTLINLAFYKQLNKKAYTINDEEIDTRPVTFFNSLVYTSIIFFSFTLKLENLHFKSRGLSIWLIFIYLSGVVCMAFLANYILKSGGAA